MRFIEEMALVEIVLLVATLWLFLAQFYLLSAITVFSLGVAVTYMFDRIASRDSTVSFDYVRKNGIQRYFEELGVLEAATLGIGIWVFALSDYALSMLFFFSFGVAFTYLIDRVRSVQA